MSVRKRYGKVWGITPENFSQIIKDSSCWMDTVEKVYGKRRGSSRSIQKRVREDDLNTEHFSLQKVPNRKNRVELREKLVKGKYWNTSNLKNQLIREGLFEEKCEKCDMGPVWQGECLVLQIDHINGNCHDNRFENLRLLCPNCHSQTPTFAGKDRRQPDNTCIDCETIIQRKSTRCTPCHLKHLKVNGNKVKLGDTGKKCLDCDENVSKRAQRCRSCASAEANKKRWKVKNRPSLEVLLASIKHTSYTATGKKYGVTDNTIRQWIKMYQKHIKC